MMGEFIALRNLAVHADSIYTHRSMFLSPLSSSPTSATHLHASSHFCAPTLLQLSSRGPLAWAFSNRGYVARADLVSGISKEWETGVCAVKMAFDEEERRVAVFERKAARVVVFDATLSDEVSLLCPFLLTELFKLTSSSPTASYRLKYRSDRLYRPRHRPPIPFQQ